MKVRRYSTVHGGGDVQVSQWCRNGLDTYVGGVDAKLAKRTTLSYDQFYGLYRGDTIVHIAGATHGRLQTGRRYH